MQCKFSFPKDTPYVFKPLALIRRVGKTYVFVEGDVTKMFMMAMAVGLIGITLSSTQSSSFSTYFTEYSMNMTPSSLLLQREGEELWTHFTTFVKNMVLSLIFR
ncbi:hypothetical protein HMI56_005585 [Coelomomyces lativittatus]|nr:hypothetical protein HMI56_005585 [Coelomomyces lativittatus]